MAKRASRQMCIPSIGDQFQLAENWEFPLYREHRNFNMLQRVRPNEEYSWHDDGSIIVTLEKGTVVQIDRIYIRKGKGEWDSITFMIKSSPADDKRIAFKKKERWGNNKEQHPTYPDGVEMKYKGARFWAKLEDVNTIQFVPVVVEAVS